MNTVKVPDNFNKDFPARMSDGRFVTDYTSSCQHNLFYQQGMNSWQYRMFLTTNGINVIDNELQGDAEEFGCCDCSHDFVPSTRFEQDCSKDYCLINEVNPEGIGIEQAQVKDKKQIKEPSPYTEKENGSLLE